MHLYRVSKKNDTIFKCFLLYIILIFGNSNLVQFQVHSIGVSFVPNILLYYANFRSSNRLRMCMRFLGVFRYFRGSGFQDLIIFCGCMILLDRPVFRLFILGSTIFSSWLDPMLFNKTWSLFLHFPVNLKKIQIFTKGKIYTLKNEHFGGIGVALNARMDQ